MPDQPARPDAPELLAPSQMPRRRKGGSERGRIAMLHALAHIEFVAIDLAVDLVGLLGGEGAALGDVGGGLVAGVLDHRDSLVAGIFASGTDVVGERARRTGQGVV